MLFLTIFREHDINYSVHGIIIINLKYVALIIDSIIQCKSFVAELSYNIINETTIYNPFECSYIKYQ